MWLVKPTVNISRREDELEYFEFDTRKPQTRFGGFTDGVIEMLL